MKLKNSLFDSMPLPFSLVYGQLGSLQLKIPVWNMFNQPLEIYITDLFALVRPKHITEWKEEVEVQAYQNANQSTLEQFELFTQNADTLLKKDPSSVDKLVAKILDNIQIKIKNIYVRYEDEFSAPNHGKFVMGVLLKEFSTHTVGPDWKTKVMVLGEELTHKVGKIENFSLFLDWEGCGKGKAIDTAKLNADPAYFKELLREEFGSDGDHEKHSRMPHNYIIDRFAMEARFAINKNPTGNQLPQLAVDLFFGGQFMNHDQSKQQVNLSVHQPQIIRILKLLEYIGYYNQFQQGALTRFKRKAISQEQADLYIRQYVEWRLASRDEKSKSQKELAASLRKGIKEIEDQYPSEKVIVLRKFASKLIDQKVAQQTQEEEISQKVQQMQKEKIGWGIFMSSSRKAQELQAVEEFKKKLELDLQAKIVTEKNQLDQELSTLTDELSKTKALTSEDFDKMPQGYIRFRLTLGVPSLCLSFVNEFDQPLFVSEIEGQSVKVDVGKGVTRAKFSVNSFNIADQWTGAKAFPNILETREFESDRFKGQDHSRQALLISFESNDQMVICPFRVTVETQKTLFIVANFPFIKELQRSSLRALNGETLDFSFFRDAAAQKAVQYMSQGKELIESLKTGQYEHKSFDISLYLQAPVILVPESIFDPTKPCLVIDTGSISLDNELVGFTQGIDYKAVQSPQTLYDKYELTLQDFQIVILEQGLPKGISAFDRGQGQAAIKQFTAKVTTFVCVEPMHSLYPTVELDVVIKSFELCLGVKFVESALRIKNAVLDQLDDTHDRAFASAFKTEQAQPGALTSMVGEQMKRKLQDKQKEVILASAEKEGDEVFFDMMEEAVDSQKLLEREKSLQAQAAKVETANATCMKVYFSIEKFHILLQQDLKGTHALEDVIAISILHLGLEVDLDRAKDVRVNLSIFKFIIEDVQRELPIAPHFRMILSSPLVDQAVESQSASRASIFNDAHQIELYNAGVTQRSLLTLIGPVKHHYNAEDDDDEEFKEALATEAEAQQTFINELDLAIKVLGSSVIDVQCVLQDMRFVFAVPTAQKLAYTGIGLQKLLEETEREHQLQQGQRLVFYREVIGSLASEVGVDSKEVQLWAKLLTNTAKENKKQPVQAIDLYLGVVQSLQLHSETLKAAPKPQAAPSIERAKTQAERLTEVLQKVSVRATLRNFAIWIPLQASSPESQIFNLSFMANLSYQQDQLRVGLAKEHVSKDAMTFSLNHLTLSMINFKDYAERQQSFFAKPQAVLQSEAHTVSDLINHSTISKMLDPCRIEISIKNEVSQQLSSSEILVNLEPLYLKLGFKHVDFANVVLSQLQRTLEYVKQLQEYGTQTASIENSPAKLVEPTVVSFSKYTPAKVAPIKRSSIKVICDTVMLSLNDDTDIRADRPLFSAHLSNLQLSMKSNESTDDAGTFILKKLGMWHRKNHQKLREHLFKDLHAVADIKMDYYNHRSQEYEPLLEPWFLQLSMSQLSPSTMLHINLESKKMLNLNMTFGMALTIKKIKERILESLKQTEIMASLEKGQQMSGKQLDSHQAWRSHLLGTQKSQRLGSELDTEEQSGFLFANHTGVPLTLAVHDPSNLTSGDAASKPLYVICPNEWRLPESLSPTFMSQSVLYKLHQEIKRQRNSGIMVECLEEDPLMFDLKIDGVQLISNIQVEGLGVYSYRGYINHKSLFSLDTQYLMADQGSFIGGILGGDEKKGFDGVQKMGIVVNITLEGAQRKISVESQVVIANNHPNPITIFAKSDFEANFTRQVQVESFGVFRVPLAWIYGKHPMSLYVDTQKGKQLLFKDMRRVFGDTAEGSLINPKKQTVVEITSTFYSSVDIIGYKCLPKSVENSNPPQYVLSFNAPIWVSNYNFQPLDLRDSTNKHSFAKIAPKETVKISTLDLVNRKQDLYWLFYEASLQGYMYLLTNNFDPLRRLEGKPFAEEFQFMTKQTQNMCRQYLTFEVKKVLNPSVRGFEGETFELRDRVLEASSTLQLMLYPKCLLVNKTLFPLYIDRQLVRPLSNDYLNSNSAVIKLKAAGYSSQDIDVSTIGISGALQLELESRDEVSVDKLPCKEYIPQKLEFGVIIEQAAAPFNKTTIVTIVPRYIILNKLGSPVVLKQKSSGGFGSGLKQVLLSGEQQVFNFQSKKDRYLMIRQPNPDEAVRLRQGGKLFEDIAAQESFWSSPFSIDDIEDFQVSYPLETHQQQIASQNDWYLPSLSNGFQRFVRVIVTTQNDASILIVLSNPVYPEYEISNKSDAQIEVAQMQDSNMLSGMFQSQSGQMIGKPYRIQPKLAGSFPFAWANRLADNRKVLIKIDGVMQEVNVDKVLEKTEISVSDKQTGGVKKYIVEILISGNSKTIQVSNADKSQSLKVPALYLQTLLKKRLGQKLMIAVDIKGLQLSFVDEAPQELLLFTLYELKLRLLQWTESRDEKGSGQFEKSTKLKLQLQHLQLDNMSSQEMPVILAPTRPFLNKLDFTEKSELLSQKKSLLNQSSSGFLEETKDEGLNDGATPNPPFLQFIVNVSESANLQNEKIPVMRVRALQIALQEFQFQIDSAIINSNLKFILELLQTFSEDQSHDLMQAKQDSYELAKDIRREQLCEQLSPERGLVSDPSEIHGKKIFIDFIHLGAIKVNLTFRLEKQAVEIDLTNAAGLFGVFNVFYPIISGVASISNSPLTFKEVVMTDVFASQEVLVSQLSKNYIRQAIYQFYKLLGSSDLIGNPVGLIGKLGTGVYELVSEPAKGLLRGPDEFVGGVGKGIQSVVGNVVQGGFESLSKISGSLYTVVKNVGGDKDAKIEKSEHIGQGLMHGLKGAGGEIIGGVTGIFTKPLEKTKQEGAKGFFKGLGSGLFGAISAPVTATLKAGSSITQGMAATATTLGNIGKAPNAQQMDASQIYSRFRPPRYINQRNVLIPFDMDLSLIHQILTQVKNGKYAVNSTIKYFATLQETSAKGELENRDPNSSILIITDSMLLYLRIDREGPSRGKPTLIYKSKLRNIRTCELGAVGNRRMGQVYVMGVVSQLDGYEVTTSYQFQSPDFAKFERIFDLISMGPQCHSTDTVRKITRQRPV